MSSTPWWVDLAKAHVLVEDELTQALLTATWEDVGVRVEHVGGEKALRGMVNDARQRGASNVFGVVDCDFSFPNGWKDAPIYRLQRHEAENYLLDFDVLAHLAGTERGEVEEAARAFAVDCCPWMAARRVLWEINGGLVENFPALGRPNQQAPLSLDAAVAEVKSEAYWKGLRNKLRQDWADAALRDLVNQHHDTFADEVNRGLWVATFSGKEVLKHLRGRFHGLAKRGSVKVSEVDLAKLVARRWRADGGAPEELMKVLGEVKRRAVA